MIDVLPYNDSSKIPAFAKESVAVLTREKLMQGDKNLFRPTEEATKQEMDSVMYILLDRYGKLLS